MPRCLSTITSDKFSESYSIWKQDERKYTIKDDDDSFEVTGLNSNKIEVLVFSDTDLIIGYIVDYVKYDKKGNAISFGNEIISHIFVKNLPKNMSIDIVKHPKE